MKQVFFYYSVFVLCAFKPNGVSSAPQNSQMDEINTSSGSFEININQNLSNSDKSREQKSLFGGNDDKFDVKIVETQNDLRDDGGFEYRTILNDGSSQYANGIVKEINGTKVVIIQGSYSYPLPNGEQLTVYYLADENGYTIQSIRQGKPKSNEVSAQQG